MILTMIIGLVGPIASGKGEAVRILGELGFRAYSLSNEVREIAQARGAGIERDSLVSIGNELRSNYAPEYLAIRVMQKIVRDKAELAVVDGLRNPAEVQCIKDNGGLIIALNASQEVRLARYLSRGRIAETSAEEFYRVDERDMGGGEDGHGQQVAICIEMADLRINNESDLENFKEKLRLAIASI